MVVSKPRFQDVQDLADFFEAGVRRRRVGDSCGEALQQRCGQRFELADAEVDPLLDLMIEDYLALFSEQQAGQAFLSFDSRQVLEDRSHCEQRDSLGLENRSQPQRRKRPQFTHRAEVVLGDGDQLALDLRHSESGDDSRDFGVAPQVK